MLSTEALPLIQATLPVVKENGEKITRHFYKRMFSHHPELKNLFNMGNQASGEQAQALAGSVYGYAANLDRPEVINPILDRIAHKHVSLGITPSQYTIVGRHLIASIGEVLGSAATPEIISAWDEAYWLMACDLVAREARIYQDVSWTAGQSWQVMDVIEKSRASDDAVAVYLRPTDGLLTRTFLPGQYISVALEAPALGLTQRRQYSLSNDPSEGIWRITVKREIQGQGPAGTISNLLHDQISAGDSLLVGPPAGDFILNTSDTPVVLLSAGIGITPVLSMLRHLAISQSKRRVIFAHANQRRTNVAHWGEVESAITSMPEAQAALWLEHETDSVMAHKGRMDLSVVENLPLDATFYLCGPMAFMKHQRQWLLAHGVASERIQYEAFGPDVFGAA